MERIMEMAARKGLFVREGVKTLNNGMEMKTYLFSADEGDVVLAQFEKECVDAAAEDDLERFFDEYIVPALEAEIVRKGNDAPQYMIDLFRTGTVFPAAINAEANEDLLKGIPHRRIMDLALVYRLIVNVTEDDICSVLYTNQNMMLAGLTEENLFERAVEYARENICTEDVYDVLAKHNFEYGARGTQGHRGELIVIRNETRWFGAGILALWAMEDGITLDLESDKPLFVLPSSIHELLVVRAVDASEEDVTYPAEMVKDVNSTRVSPEERLSNSVYMYDPETKKVKMAKYGEPLSCCDEMVSYLRRMHA